MCYVTYLTLCTFMRVAHLHTFARNVITIFGVPAFHIITHGNGTVLTCPLSRIPEMCMMVKCFTF